MADKPFNLQDHFLNAVRRSKHPVTIFVTKGAKLQGRINWFDAFSVLLQRDGKGQLVYKHAIATVMPVGEIDGFAPPNPAVSQDAPLQDRFLAAAVQAREPVTIYLVNGVMLQGEVTGFDQFSLVLGRGRLIQLVYKHAISAIQPEEALSLGPSVSEETKPADAPTPEEAGV